jgi:hypothetical protein
MPHIIVIEGNLEIVFLGYETIFIHSSIVYFKDVIISTISANLFEIVFNQYNIVLGVVLKCFAC